MAEQKYVVVNGERKPWLPTEDMKACEECYGAGWYWDVFCGEAERENCDACCKAHRKEHGYA